MERKQLKRGVRGWRMLPNSRSVARPSRWGSPFHVRRSAYNGWTVIQYITVDMVKTPYQEWIGRGGNWTKEQATRKATELYREYATERLKRDPAWLDPLSGLDNVY